MQQFLFLVFFLILAAVINSFAPKRDYSHVPQEYRHLVKFAESAGM